MKSALGFLFFAGLLAPAQENSSAVGQPVDFVRDVQPILKEACHSCHGEKKQKGQLRLDSRRLALQGGVSGKVIVPGNAKGSRLVELLVSADPDERMPQKAEPLPQAQIEVLRAWIDQGAVWPEAASAADAKLEKHWAYVKPVRREPPAVKGAVRNPIDAFLAAEREARGLAARPEAPRHVLLRRVTLDLVGLPPTREELRSFLADPSPGAYERVVDRLLADPRYGERWGRHWMDVWRYSDWAGYGKEVRDSQPHVWRWRDWIVESLNAGKGYDRMVLEMLAGDEIAPEDPQTLRATGYLVRSWYKFNRTWWMEQVVEHTSKAFIATTMNCAKCHNHFFDPISHAEYYQFRAFFEPYHVRTEHVPGESDTAKDGLVRAYDAEPAVPTYLFVRGNESQPDKSRAIAPGVPRAIGGSPLKVEPVPLPPSAVAPEKRAFVVHDLLRASDKSAASARAKVEPAREKLRKAVDAAEGRPDEGLAPLRAAVDAAEEELAMAALEAPLAEARHASLEATLRVEQVEDAGWKHSEAWRKASDEAASAQRRLALLEAGKARFVALGGVLKAATPEARKKLEEAEKALAKLEKEPAAYAPRKLPSYPPASTGRRLALARWIADPENPLTARVAVNHLWMRHFGKAIVPTVFEFGKHGRPPSHPALLDWLATELVREKWSLKKLHLLMVTSAAYRMDSAPDAGNLAKDPENVYLWRMNARRMEAEAVRDSVLYLAGGLDAARGGPDLDPAQGLAGPRRSLYFRHAQEKQMEFLVLFDAASVTECYERTESIVPQQALALFNSALVLEKGRLLAARLARESPDPAAFVAHAFEHVLGRPPSEAERAECLRFLEGQAALLAGKGKLTAFASGPATKVGPAADPAQRAREDLVEVLFNHNDFVTVR